MTGDEETREPQYEELLRIRREHGIASLGLMFNGTWNEDPRRAVFTLSRYKFVAKLLEGREKVLEVGCADAFASRIVQQSVRRLTVVDFDPVFIEDARARANPHWPMDMFVHDILDQPVPGPFDAAYSLDVLEHIDPEREHDFMRNSLASLSPEGVLIAGMPSLESQAHASPQSKEGHVNCKTGKNLKALFEEYFHTVFVFSMNDEVVHTGFFPMAHYLIAVGSHRKDRPE